MTGARGKITRAKGGKQRTVYLSDVLGVWEEKQRLHIAVHRGQEVQFNISSKDGLLFEAMLMLYRHGLAQPPGAAK
jgi:hypothetical protein